VKTTGNISQKSLQPSFDFLKKLTNQTGIIQHTKFGVPDRHNGYSLDDNARALLVSIGWFRIFGDKKALELASIYLAWLYHARTEDRFYNFASFDNRFRQDFSEDGYARAFWALGYSIYATSRSDLTRTSKELVSEVKERLTSLISPRAIAYSLLGLYHLSRKEPEVAFWKETMRILADKLVTQYEKVATKNWRFFEDRLTYSNHILPLGLLKAYLILEEERYLKVALESLEFVEANSRLEGVPAPIGSFGWYIKGRKRATFDQQPIEASEACLAFIAAYEATGDSLFRQFAYEWFGWYYGNNIKGLSLLDPETGGCFDALNAEGINANEGAESIIAYLMAALAIADLEKSD
jgi:hypothetical protein